MDISDISIIRECLKAASITGGPTLHLLSSFYVSQATCRMKVLFPGPTSGLEAGPMPPKPKYNQSKEC